MKTAFENSKELIQKVSPAMSFKGEDYETWKAAAREKLSALLGMEKFKKVDPETEIEYEKTEDHVTKIRFTFQSEDGYRVPCYLMLPEGVENPPVIICLQGHSKGMHISIGKPIYDGDEKSISGGDRDFCVRAVKEGFAAIAMEQRNFGECGGNEYGPQCLESSMTALIMGRTTIGERVWDVSRLIDVIQKDFADRVDIENICCMGNSGGGTATAYVAALEDRIKLAMPSCAIATYKDSIGAMMHCSCNYVPNIALFFDMSDLIAMSYPKYYIQVSGRDDIIFPIATAKKMFNDGTRIYNMNNEGDKCTFIEGDGGHRFYADDAWPIVHKYIK